jgi:hypothetical protein
MTGLALTGSCAAILGTVQARFYPGALLYRRAYEAAI